MKTTFEFCSFRYLNIWENHDKKYHQILSKPSTEKDKLKALKDAGTFYKVARTLPTRCDDNRRYGYVLDILEDIKESDFKKSPIEQIFEVEKKISEKCEKRSFLSLTTKFLWLKVKQPIIIYDSRTRNALGTDNEDLKQFYEKWHHEFKKVEPIIKKACENLESMHLYLPNQIEGLQEEIKEISKETWFHERVFDTYLWNAG